MGRKKLEHKLDRIISLRVNSDEYHSWLEKSIEYKMRSIGEYIRHILTLPKLTKVTRSVKIELETNKGGNDGNQERD